MRQASFRIDAGTAVALVGPSAAGKSSLLRGIVGVWPCAAGVIRLDGYDIKQWDPEKLGRHIGYLPQDIELFSGTVAQNIARFTEYESQEVIDAAMLAAHAVGAGSHAGIVSRRVHLDDPYAEQKAVLLSVLARVNGAKCVW